MHLLLLYMCITGYKGVFEHSKHVLLSHLSFSGWTFPFFLVSAIVSTSFFIVRPKPRLPSISFTLSRASVLLMDTEEFSLLLLLMKSPPPLYIYDSINTFSPFKQNKEEKKRGVKSFFYARSKRISCFIFFSSPHKINSAKAIHYWGERRLNFWSFVTYMSCSIFFVYAVINLHFVLCITRATAGTLWRIFHLLSQMDGDCEFSHFFFH